MSSVMIRKTKPMKLDKDMVDTPLVLPIYKCSYRGIKSLVRLVMRSWFESSIMI
ncbi:hypothetical protein HanIR_Chr06g0291451 [Helianthus annuus]|nr:hypothetical protein HanIR_Chr06g0291451 [Helianthus annuus]